MKHEPSDEWIVLFLELIILLIAMPLTIGAVALLGWWALGLAPASAILLGAALAPTDPVLARSVQVGPPGEDQRHADVDHDRDPDGQERSHG